MKSLDSLAEFRAIEANCVRVKKGEFLYLDKHLSGTSFKSSNDGALGNCGPVVAAMGASTVAREGVKPPDVGISSGNSRRVGFAAVVN